MLIKYSSLRWLFGITTVLVFGLAGAHPAAASIWTHLVSGNASGSWGTSANWSGGIPNATDAVADFSTLNLAVDSTVNNDAARAVGTLKFDDINSGNNWALTGSELTLATSSGSPTIDVIDASQATTLAAGLAGSQGFVKSGAGTLLLSGGTANTIGGMIVITNGAIQTANGASLKNVTATIVVAAGTELRVAGAFDNNANSCPLVLNGTGDGSGSEGALHGYYNQTMNGPITLNSDSKISHNWNLFTLNGPITASGNYNLEMAITVSGQATLAANGDINLGLGTLTISSVAGGAPVTLNGVNTLGGVVVQTNGTVVFGSANAIGGSGPKVAINDGGTAALSGTDLNPLLARTATNSAGAIAFNGVASSVALNFGDYTNLSLGSVGSSSYSGVLTPGGSDYQLGGGGGTLTVSSGLNNQGPGLVVNGDTSSSTVILTGSHTYTNATIIRGGTLMVNGVLSGPLVVESGGILAVGVATSTIDTLTVNNSVVLGGSSVFAINRSGAQKADRLVANSLVLDGTIVVTNVGAAPVLGDSFQLFSITGAISNAQPVLNLPPLSGGLMWDVSQLVVNGTISVAQLTNVVGQTNWPSLLPQEIQSAYNAGFSNVTINPGTYVMANGSTTAFVFNGWNNFTINASNTFFVVDRGAQYGASGFSLINCSNVTVSGATVRSKVYPFTQGRVTAIGTNAGVLYCNWQISEGYPTNDFNWWFDAVYASNAVINLKQGDIYYGNYYGTNSSGAVNNTVYLGNRTWQLKFPGWLTSFSFQTNDWLVARWSGQGFAYYFNSSTDCTLQGCVSQTGGFGTYRETGGGGNHILDCKIQPAPLPPDGGTEAPVVACAADGVHASGFTYPGLDVENFVCEGVFLDDCLTIHGGNNNVVSSSGNTVTFDGAGKFVVGDPVRIYSADGNYFAQANCTAIQNVGGGNYQLTLDQSLAIPGGCVGENPKYSGAGYKVVNCHLGNVRSRAILNKADDGLITGCTIQNAQTAMQFGPEIYWGGGGYSWNLSITNNTILNCGSYGIDFTTAGAIGNLNNTIRNNYFQNVALGKALNFSGCGGLTIDGNLFVNPAPDYNLIYLSQTTNVVLERNFVTNQTSSLSLIGTGSGVSGLHYVANGIISEGQKQLFNQYSSLVLDGGASPVVQNTLEGALNSVFTLNPVGNGYCVLACGGLVLDAGNAGNAGSSLQVNSYTGSDGQLWSLWPVGTTNVIMVNKLSGLAADVTSTSAGTTVIQSVINTNAADMQWYLQEVIGSTTSQSGVWVRLVGGNASGVWGTGANWQSGIVATGTDAVADFTANNITVNSIVTNETARAIGSLIFNNTTSGKFWDVDGSTNRQLTLASSSGQPSINVTNTQMFLGGFNGAQGFVKNGNGVLNIFGSTYINSVSGPILVNAGSLTTASGKAFHYITGDITVAAGATFGANANFDGATFSNNIYLSGTGVGTPTGYVYNNTSIPSSPASEVYNASTTPWGALDLYGNATLNGTITLNTDSKITHSWNYGYINGPIIATGAGKNLELRTYQSAQPDLIINGDMSLGTGALTITGTGNQGITLNSSNNFSGGTFLTAGILKLGNANALGDAGTISIGGGATLDLSGVGSTFVLGASQTLSNSVSGTGIINGTLDAGGGTVSVACSGGTPALTVTSGTLMLSGATAFNINNTGPALDLGIYPIISTSGGGAVGGVMPASVSVSGGGLAGGATASLQFSGGVLNLVVIGPAPTPTILPVHLDGLGNIIIRTETAAGHKYLLLSTTNMTPPVSWMTNSTTAGTGGIITNTVMVTPTPPDRFFRYLVL